jgi:2-isopropylmalate synthase
VQALQRPPASAARAGLPRARHRQGAGSGASARAAAYLELRIADTRTLFGVGIDGNIVTASMKAVVSGLLRSGAWTGQHELPAAHTATA